MKEEIETKSVHENIFRERKSFANKTTETLPKGPIPTLDMCCFTGLFANLIQLLIWNDCLICFPKV